MAGTGRRQRQLLGELVATFRADCPRCWRRSTLAIREDQPDDLCRAAHTLKSMLLFFEATAASEAALRLETMGRNAELAGTRRGRSAARGGGRVASLRELAALPGS